jgi:hypothetical protein
MPSRFREALPERSAGRVRGICWWRWHGKHSEKQIPCILEGDRRMLWVQAHGAGKRRGAGQPDRSLKPLSL